MRTYKIHFIRHGQTQGNIEGRYIGRTNLPVCPEGFAEMAQLRDRFDYPEIDVLYSSPLLRCRQTAAFLYPDYSMTVVEDLQEMDFGDFEGKTVADLKLDPDFSAWMKNAQTLAPPGGETGLAFAERLQSGLNQVFADMIKNDYSSAAVLCHGGVIMTLLAAFGLPQEQMGRWVTENATGYTVVMTPQLWMRDEKFEITGLIPEALFQLEEEDPLDKFDWENLTPEQEEWLWK